MSEASGFLILHVEDDDSDARVVSRAVSADGYPVRIDRAADGKTALCLVTEISDGLRDVPDLILLDLKLPFLSGFEVLKAARTIPVLKHVPIVVLSSSSVEGDRILCDSLGGTEFVVKPIDYHVFRSLVQDLVAKYLGPSGS